MMTLFGSSRSPYVRKVMVAAHEIGVHERVTLVRKNVAILKPDDEVTKANPLGKDFLPWSSRTGRRSTTLR